MNILIEIEKYKDYQSLKMQQNKANLKNIITMAKKPLKRILSSILVQQSSIKIALLWEKEFYLI